MQLCYCGSNIILVAFKTIAKLTLTLNFKRKRITWNQYTPEDM